MAYTADEIKVAAYNRTELPDMTANERMFWIGMAYCYDWYRYRPGDQEEECRALAARYAEDFQNGIIKEVSR